MDLHEQVEGTNNLKKKVNIISIIFRLLKLLFRI